MSGKIDTLALERWVWECNRFQPEQFDLFVVEGQVVGAVARSLRDRLAAHPEVFAFDGRRVTLNPELETSQARTEAVERVLEQWYAQGVFTGWRGERDDVSTGFGAPPCLSIERSAAPLFGVQVYGVHINGFVRRPDGIDLWVAQRSAHKPEYPGRLDHLVAGGLASGMSAYETVVKECAEEAAVPESLARSVRPAGLVSYRRSGDGWSSRVVLFVYDLELPGDFVPRNTDGEVDEFYLWPVERVIETVSRTRKFKTNCNLVIIDFLVRHGYLCPEDRHYIEIVCGLRPDLFDSCSQ
ncbi:MAG: DUF4743 domain-containing protein [Anaerolineae bacterium]|nr:DUF4743 domain-containing protein [Anaerolineae bacterium]